MGFLGEGMIRINVTVPIGIVAKIRAAIEGKSVVVRRDGIAEPFRRPMSVSDYVAELVAEKLADVELNESAREWLDHEVQRCAKNRMEGKQKVAEGINRKPRSEWKKRGRKPGVVYPKYIEAMKRLQMERAQKKAEMAACRDVTC